MEEWGFYFAVFVLLKSVVTWGYVVVRVLYPFSLFFVSWVLPFSFVAPIYTLWVSALFHKFSLCILPRYMSSQCLSCCFIAVPSCIPFLFFITLLQKALYNVWKLSDSSFCSSLDAEPCFTSDPWIRVRDLVFFICLSRGKVAQISFPKKTKKKLIASLCHI